jgi:hypothetical protein
VTDLPEHREERRRRNERYSRIGTVDTSGIKCSKCGYAVEPQTVNGSYPRWIWAECGNCNALLFKIERMPCI